MASSFFSHVDIERQSDVLREKYQGEFNCFIFYLKERRVAVSLVESWPNLDTVVLHDIHVGQNQARKGYATQALIWLYEYYEKLILPYRITTGGHHFWRNVRRTHPEKIDARQLQDADYANLISALVSNERLDQIAFKF